MQTWWLHSVSFPYLSALPGNQGTWKDLLSWYLLITPGQRLSVGAVVPARRLSGLLEERSPVDSTALNSVRQWTHTWELRKNLGCLNLNVLQSDICCVGNWSETLMGLELGLCVWWPLLHRSEMIFQCCFPKAVWFKVSCCTVHCQLNNYLLMKALRTSC